jgi:hypothetical protein
VFLLVFIWHKKGISIEVAMMYLEACFVGNPVAIPEGRGTRKMVAGRVMESAVAERLDKISVWKAGNGCCSSHSLRATGPVHSDFGRKATCALDDMENKVTRRNEAGLLEYEVR